MTTEDSGEHRHYDYIREEGLVSGSISWLGDHPITFLVVGLTTILVTSIVLYMFTLLLTLA